MGTADGSGGGSARGPLYPQLSLVALASTPAATTPPPRRAARAAPSNMAALAEGEGEVGPNGSREGLRCGFPRRKNIYFWGQMQIPRQISAAPCLSVTSWGCGAALLWDAGGSFVNAGNSFGGAGPRFGGAGGTLGVWGWDLKVLGSGLRVLRVDLEVLGTVLGCWGSAENVSSCLPAPTGWGHPTAAASPFGWLLPSVPASN